MLILESEEMGKALSIKLSPLLRMAVVIAFFFILANAMSQTKVTYGQYMYLMKSLKPSLKNIGVMASALTPEEIASLGRAANGLGVKLIAAKVTDVRDISSLYRRLVDEHKVEILWIPDGEDKLLLGVGFEYLRENTILDRIGLCVPSRELVSAGALCSFERLNGKLAVYVNQQVAEVVGINLPSEKSASIAYIVH